MPESAGLGKNQLQYFGHVIQRAHSLEKTPMLGKIEGRSTRGRQRIRWLDGIIDSWIWVCANSVRQWRTGKPGMLQSMESDTTERLSNSNSVCFCKWEGYPSGETINYLFESADKVYIVGCWKILDALLHQREVLELQLNEKSNKWVEDWF